MKVLLFWLWFSVMSSPILFGLALIAIVGCILATRKIGKTYRSAWRIGVILFAILICSTVSAWKIQRFSSHVIDPNAYEAVEVGMTQEQVANLLGEPSKRELMTKEQVLYWRQTPIGTVHSIWRYDKSGVFEYVEIRFDEAGLVKSKVLDR